MGVRQENRTILWFLLRTGGIPPATAEVLREGANHAYSCTCLLCRVWWALVGPDEDTGTYGPFGATIEE